jgi:glycosyltransferase EpsE
MSNIKVSILMGVYNCAGTLSESIESLINQSFTNWELIMCDDGSTDSTRILALKYSTLYPDKIKVIYNETNRGLSYSLNKCFESSIGNFIARQDGDDLSSFDRMKKLYDFLTKNPCFDIVSSAMIHFDESGEWGRSKVVLRPTKTDFILGTPFCHAASMFTRKAFLAVNGYTESQLVLRVEDYDLWSKMYSKGFKGANLDEPLYKMRDDRSAFLRRKYKYRINEAIALFKSYKRLRISFTKYIYIIRPLIVGLLPSKVYNHMHKRKLRNYVFTK